MTVAQRIPVSSELVERTIMDLARFGAHGETGVWRTVYSPEWWAASTRFAELCEEGGMTARMDAVGNVWGRAEGTERGTAIVSGSHIDSQRPGGRYDGVLGAIAGMIAIRTLLERFGPPKRPLEALSLCEEEGSRFPSTNFWGSRAITGLIGPGEAEALRGYADESIADAMREVGLDPARIPEAERNDLGAFIELHIEQGPILEHAGLPVGIVTGITGIRHYRVEVTGVANHAGAFPMDLRRDPMLAASEIISGVIYTAHRLGRPAVTTVGRMDVDPNGPAIVPERVIFSVDARHPDSAARADLYEKHESFMRDVAARHNLDISWTHTVDHAPCSCDPDLVAIIEESAREQEIPAMRMASGAAHDSQQMALKCPVAMIFVQSKDGRSHTPAEFSSVEHCVAGIEVLAAALHKLAY
jgi:allantoate deiminase